MEVRKGGKNAETCECEEAREEDLKLWLKSVSCLSLSLSPPAGTVRASTLTGGCRTKGKYPSRPKNTHSKWENNKGSTSSQKKMAQVQLVITPTQTSFVYEDMINCTLKSGSKGYQNSSQCFIPKVTISSLILILCS